ncbi:uncharacterized protein BDR25DRAFT_317694 [Lindgomyces ingoldianus]|uniref:Uncharacterized protein n=1 Tax=Lindgomyces ingoldianus TaxID=673940 RepID=A0ACB6QHD0_9PLEO|nr:uncharacterized protein BDR25DRAFT_317694 [Lindgomyces ingoldianus]KAF2466290.1 hypothetical protein BDR25DRAFT_317694 [Lindgomyces ingoldianus]
MGNMSERGQDSTNTQGVSLPEWTVPSEQKESSHLGKDAAQGAGTIGAEGLPGHELNRQHDDSNLRRSAEQQSEPQNTGDTSRSFPLAGGVTHRQTTDNPSITRATRVPEEEPTSHVGRNTALGTGVVGAGGLVAHELNRHHEDDGVPHRRTTDNPLTTQDTRTTQEGPTSHTGRNMALGSSAISAGSLAAHEFNRCREEDNTERTTLRSTESNAPSTGERALGSKDKGATSMVDEHAHGGQSHAYAGDPCPTDTTYLEEKDSRPMFTEGPHVTGTANRTDPHLHIPGEYPDPTPIEELSQPTFWQEEKHEATEPTTIGGVRETYRGEPRSTQELIDQSHQPSSEHHYCGDVALKGAGAATAGGLYASQHEHKPDSTPFASQQREAARVQPEAISTEQPPQPSIEHHHSRDAALIGGGAATSGGLYARQREGQPVIGPASATIGSYKSNIVNVLDQKVQPEPENMKSHGTSEPQKSGKREQAKGQHHYGRDATLTGGAGAAGLGSYEAGKHHQREATDIEGQQPIPTGESPYSSMKIDPRVDNKPSLHGSIGQHHGQDTAFAGGAGVAGYEAYKHRSGQQETAPMQPTHAQVDQLLPGKQNEPRQLEHRYGRDAVVAGGVRVAGYEAYTHHSGQHDTAVTLPTQAQVNQPTPQSYREPRQPECHYGQDAAVVGGTGAADYEGYRPGYEHAAPKQPSQAQASQPERHCGQDVAAVGGAGLAGYGTYETAKHYVQHRSTQPSAAMDDQRYDPTAQGAHDPKEASQHHYGRDATIAGGGVGLASARAYAASSHGNDQTRQPPMSQEFQQPTATSTHNRYDSVQDPNNKSHQQQQAQPNYHKRDAAASGAGAAAGVGFGYAYSQHEAEKAEKERLSQQKSQQQEFEKQQKEQQKDLEKQRKDQQKDLEHKQKEFEKEQAKEHKQHAKAAAAEDKHRNSVPNPYTVY